MSRVGVSAVESATRPSARQRIVSGARRHFFAHGFRGVSMDDLALELGMSKKTLYAQFPSKTAIVKAAILDKFGDLEEELGQIMAECSADFAEALRQLLTCVQRHTEEIQAPFLHDIRRDAPELFKLVESRRAAVVQRYFGTLFAAGRKERMIRKDISTELIVEILLGVIQAIMNPPKMGQLGLTPKSGFSAIISIILDGILTATGRAKR
jgi:AcrR family transcriptional regulator